MHTVAVLALDGVIPFDLSAPVDTFGWARPPDGREPYRVRVCSAREEVSAGAFTVRAPYGLETLAEADTIILPGVADPPERCRPRSPRALRAAAANGTRIASICVGAFLFAATGLLDGLRATTHWLAAPDLARRHPRVTVDPNVLYVDNGQFLTSAGAAAALDMCLHMIRRTSARRWPRTRPHVGHAAGTGGRPVAVHRPRPPRPRPVRPWSPC